MERRCVLDEEGDHKLAWFNGTTSCDTTAGTAGERGKMDMPKYIPPNMNDCYEEWLEKHLALYALDSMSNANCIGECHEDLCNGTFSILLESLCVHFLIALMIFTYLCVQ